MRLNDQTRVRYLCVGFVCWLSALGGLASQASGQLRTGREQRTLYHDQLVSQQKSKPKSGRQDSSVRQASYADRTTPQSILEEKNSAPQVGSGLKAPASPAPTPETESVIHEPMASEGYIDSPVSGGCDCGACSGSVGGACDDFFELAPTCAATCGVARCNEPLFTGCGPIAMFLRNLSVRAEVPLYWRRAAGPPALVTTSRVGTAQGVAGELGQTTTSTLFGNGPLDDSVQPGFRLTLGTWLGASEQYGLMFRYWTAGEQDETTTFSSAQNAILARPFFNTTTGNGTQDTQLIAFATPNAVERTGSIDIQSTSDVDGLNVILRRLMYRDRFTRVDWLYGYQHVGIDETLSIRSNTLVVGNQNPQLTGATIAVSDRFATQNDFHGVTYGLMSDRRVGNWKLESMFRMGLGNLRRRVQVAGTTTTTSAAGASNTSSQGLLARNTNNQPFEDDTFIVLPEVGLSLAYQIRPGLDFNVGYNYMLIPKVAQASRQIDKQLAVNLSDPLTGNLDPQLDFEERKYWLHSLGLGLQWNY